MAHCKLGVNMIYFISVYIFQKYLIVSDFKRFLISLKSFKSNIIFESIWFSMVAADF